MSERDYVWLARWEPIEAPGRHTRIYPAGFATGYKYRMPDLDRRPKAQPVYSMRDRVNRAIPADGKVADPGPSWKRSPQVRFWLEAPKKSLKVRLKEWLTGRKAA